MPNAVLGRPCPRETGSRFCKAGRKNNIVVFATAADAGPSKSSPYVVRRATAADCKSLAAVCGESFGRGNFPELDVEAITRLEERYAVVIEEDMQVKLLSALDAKAQAQREHREFRLRRYMQQLRAELAALRGEPARFVTQPSPQDVRTVQRWMRSRQFMALVVEHRGCPPAAGAPAPAPASASAPASAPAPASASASDGDGAAVPAPAPAPAPGGGAGAVVGCATMSLMQPEALLPPPFPSNKPFRLYVSNMSVLPSHRRRGLARKLLQQCERVARLWGHTSLWLHVKRTNTGAEALYRSLGYRRVEEGGLRLLPGPLAQVLMRKELPPLPGGCPLVLSRGGAAAAAPAAAAAAAAGAAGGAQGRLALGWKRTR